MVQDIAATKGLLSNSIFFCASCSQFYHYGLKPETVPGVQWDLCNFSGTGGMAGEDFLQDCSRHCGWDLVGMENCHMDSPTRHLPMENPILAPLFPFLCVATVSPLEIILKGMVLLQGEWSKKASEKGLQEGGSALTKQGEGRDRHRNPAEHKDAQPQPPFDSHFISQAGPHHR